MAKLNAVIAAEKSIKGRTERSITDIYHLLQKNPLFNGQTRVYDPFDAEGDKIPTETQIIQQNVQDLLGQFKKSVTDLYDVTATRECANKDAKADVVVDGVKILTDVPVILLLFIEKRIEDLRTVVRHLPLLDPSETWTIDPNTGTYRSDPTKNIRTKKTSVPIVLSEATKEHPAQVQLATEDKPVGTWTTTKFSTAIGAVEQREMLERIEKLHRAVVVAREEGNSVEAPSVKIADPLLKFVFGEK